MTATFKELWHEMGIDEESTPAGAMIPYKGKNFVRLGFLLCHGCPPLVSSGHIVRRLPGRNHSLQ